MQNAKKEPKKEKNEIHLTRDCSQRKKRISTKRKKQILGKKRFHQRRNFQPSNGKAQRKSSRRTAACKSFNKRSGLKKLRTAWSLATKCLSNLATNSTKKSSVSKIPAREQAESALWAARNHLDHLGTPALQVLGTLPARSRLKVGPSLRIEIAATSRKIASARRKIVHKRCLPTQARQ